MTVITNHAWKTNIRTRAQSQAMNFKQTSNHFKHFNRINKYDHNFW